MKKIFKTLTTSLLATAVYGIPVAIANTAIPEPCAANDLTLVYNLDELNFDVDTASTRLKGALANGVFASQNVSVGASFDLPDAGVPGTFKYVVNDQEYSDKDTFEIPATSDNTVTVKVRFTTDGALAKGMFIGNGTTNLFSYIMLLYAPDPRGGYRLPITYLKNTSDRFITSLKLANEETTLEEFLVSMGAAQQFIDIMYTLDGYELRGFVPTTSNNETLRVNVNTDTLPYYALTEQNSYRMDMLNMLNYSEDVIGLQPAFAQNCDRETTVTACDISAPTKPICKLNIGEDGSVNYENACCAGYHISETTTE